MLVQLSELGCLVMGGCYGYSVYATDQTTKLGTYSNCKYVLKYLVFECVVSPLYGYYYYSILTKHPNSN